MELMYITFAKVAMLKYGFAKPTQEEGQAM